MLIKPDKIKKRVNVIDIAKIKQLLANDKINLARTSELTGIRANLLSMYRSGTRKIEKMSLEQAQALMPVAGDADLIISLTGLPSGIVVRPLRKGGANYHAMSSLHGRPVHLGTYKTAKEAIAARNEFNFTHRNQIKVVKKAKEIAVTPELKAKVKKAKGISLYRDRHGRITGFRAEFMRDGKRHYLGKFDTFAAAKAVYDKAIKAGD